MTLTKIEIEQAEIESEVRYEQLTYKDAITDAKKSVKVIDDRRTKIFTEAQVDSQIIYWQGLKDEITALNEVAE